MDVLGFFLGIVMIVAASTVVILYALTLHHRQVMDQHRIEESANQAKFLIMDKALDKGLPPGRVLDR